MFQATPNLAVSAPIVEVVEQELLPNIEISSQVFWEALETLLAEFLPENRALLEKRNKLQHEIDSWWLARREQGKALDDLEEQAKFLEHIGYLVPEPADFTIKTSDVDPEISIVAGPQLVVPIKNARFAINATNARWGSLFDALYGTNALPKSATHETGGEVKGLDPLRAAKVFDFADSFLDMAIPLEHNVLHSEIVEYGVNMDPAGDTGATKRPKLTAKTKDGRSVGLVNPHKFVGFVRHNGDIQSASHLLLQNNGLHIELRLLKEGEEHPVAKLHHASLKDIQLESAVTVIQDFEDSVAAVDAEDKAEVYRNWIGLMEGTLEATFQKGSKTVRRALKGDITYTSADGKGVSELTLPGRSLLLARNNGLHMYTDAVLLNNEPVPEGLLDVMITAAAAIHDLKGLGRYTNSRMKSVYIVKPKLHGPEEVAFVVKTFSRVESLLNLPANTLKIGIMDEERRTSTNLKACVREAMERVVFINTGFMDRTGDEIHTAMTAGPVMVKDQIKSQRWLQAYEDINVDVGLSTGFSGRGQIGKGMWAKPDDMDGMLKSKKTHPYSGASTAWTPSPTAATLHATHYHEIDVIARQKELKKRPKTDRLDLLFPPICEIELLSKQEIQRELQNSAQGILGYVVRWIEQGIGCSKVPDLNNVGLMEDRATLRINSQLLSNWLYHKVITEEELYQTFTKMADVVDKQNEKDSVYIPMKQDLENSTAFQAALRLVLQGAKSPNGYTEDVLHDYRRRAKAKPSSTPRT